ncbi:MAG: LCP family protein [Lachnospiraceae bacterium]
MDDNGQESKEETQVKISKKKKIIVLVTIVIVLLSGGLFCSYQWIKNYVHGLINTAEYVKDNNDISIDSKALETANQEAEDEINLELDEHISSISKIDMANANDVINILIIGVDRRDSSWYGNSDCIILLSIKEGAQQIYMTSIMRDTYVLVPNYGNQKINNAHAIGGPQLLMDTIELNFNLDIDYYISFDFNSFMDIIDAVGGIELDLTPDEIRVINQYYLSELNKLDQAPAGTDYLPEGVPYSGIVNGKQALAYCRVRYVGNSDYQRTERQRIVIQKVIEKVRSMGVTKIFGVAETLFPTLMHNIPNEEFQIFLGKSFTYINYDVISDRIPYEGLYIVDVYDNLALNWDQTLAILHQNIYGELNRATEESNTDTVESGASIVEEVPPVEEQPNWGVQLEGIPAEENGVQ